MNVDREFARRINRLDAGGDEMSPDDAAERVRRHELRCLFETFLPDATQHEIDQVATIQDDLELQLVRMEGLLEQRDIDNAEFAVRMNGEMALARRRVERVLGVRRANRLFGLTDQGSLSFIFPDLVDRRPDVVSVACRHDSGIRRRSPQSVCAHTRRARLRAQRDPPYCLVRVVDFLGSQAALSSDNRRLYLNLVEDSHLTLADAYLEIGHFGDALRQAEAAMKPAQDLRDFVGHIRILYVMYKTSHLQAGSALGQIKQLLPVERRTVSHPVVSRILAELEESLRTSKPS